MSITDETLSRGILGSTCAQLGDAPPAADGESIAFCIDTDGLPLIGLPVADRAVDVTLRVPLRALSTVLVLTGTSTPLPAGAPARARFQRYFPDGAVAPHKLTPTHCVLEPAAVGGPTGRYDLSALVCPFPDGAEQRMVEHMNADHVDAMRAYCSHAGVACRDGEPQMVAVDQHGFFLRVGSELTRFDFDQCCDSPLDVRTALVRLAERARNGDTAAPGDE